MRPWDTSKLRIWGDKQLGKKIREVTSVEGETSEAR